MLLRLIRRQSGKLCQVRRCNMMTTEANNVYDMIVVGGGMVGFGLAALSDLGAWNFITSKRLSPVKAMKVWETQSEAYLTFARDPLAHIVENNLVTESLLRVLEGVCSTANLVVSHDTSVQDIYLPSETDSQELVQLTLTSKSAANPGGDTVTQQVGADGFQSAVRKAAGIPTVSWSHGQSAVVSIACMEKENLSDLPTASILCFSQIGQTVFTRVLMLKSVNTMPHNCCSIIWSTTDTEADRLLALSDTAFVTELNEALSQVGERTPSPGRILGKLGQSIASGLDRLLPLGGYENEADAKSGTPPSPPRVAQLQTNNSRKRYPLGFQHANSYHSSRRVVLVGDAAHRILPLAGQGVNLGFGDVTSLVHLLEEAVSQGADLGSTAFLSDYTTQRQRAVVPVAATMELLNLIYSTDAFRGQPAATSSLPVSPLRAWLRLLAGFRAAGMETVQSSKFLKNFLIEAAVSGNIGVPSGSL